MMRGTPNLSGRLWAAVDPVHSYQPGVLVVRERPVDLPSASFQMMPGATLAIPVRSTTSVPSSCCHPTLPLSRAANREPQWTPAKGLLTRLLGHVPAGSGEIGDIEGYAAAQAQKRQSGYDEEIVVRHKYDFDSVMQSPSEHFVTVLAQHRLTK